MHCPIFYLVMANVLHLNFKFCLLLRRLKYIIPRALEIGKTKILMRLCFGDYKKGLHEIFFLIAIGSISLGLMLMSCKTKHLFLVQRPINIFPQVN